MLTASHTAVGQELNCQVDVNTAQLQGTNKAVFTSLADAIKGYMNTTKFSNAQIANNERIECRLMLTVGEYTDERVKGDLQIQSSRPVYNSTYTTTLLNFKDTRVEFDFREGDQLVFNEQENDGNLSAILDFYAYLILALDFDSFSPRGGDQFFERCANIVQRAQSSGETGWKAFEDTKNRSAVLSAYTDVSTSALRDMMYNYHRQGLDQMVVSPDKGRATITESLQALKSVYDVQPMSVGLSMTKDAKLDELVNIYSKAQADERESVAKLLLEIYPTEQERIEKIKNPPAER